MALNIERVNIGFAEYHRKLLGRDYDGFVSALSRPQRKSIRINTLKTCREKIVSFLEKNKIKFSPVPWCGDGLFVDERADLDTVEHQLGYYYVQNSSSMIPALALNPAQGESVLDLTAAPGSKTSQLAALMENSGVLVANEASHVRVKALVINIQKCGVSNAVVTCQDGVGYERNRERFDKILLDAPCSDIGTARKNPDVIRRWSSDRIKNLAVLQKKLILSAYSCLKPGGVLVYSTCTTSLEENEQVVEYLLDKRGGAVVEEIKLHGLKTRHGLTDKAKNTIRLLPQDNDTESYYIAKVVRNA